MDRVTPVAALVNKLHGEQKISVQIALDFNSTRVRDSAARAGGHEGAASATGGPVTGDCATRILSALERLNSSVAACREDQAKVKHAVKDLHKGQEELRRQVVGEMLARFVKGKA